jgi:hypothetical protein
MKDFQSFILYTMRAPHEHENWVWFLRGAPAVDRLELTLSRSIGFTYFTSNKGTIGKKKY